MVKIHFWQEKDNGTSHLKVQGHANTAPAGQDLVCSAATMLVYTVAQSMQFMWEIGQLEEKPKVKIRNGKASVIARPKKKFYADALHAFWTAQCGAHVLSCNYPEAVSLNHLTM